MNKVVVDAAACKACGLCIRACAKNVLAFGEQLNTKGYKYVMVRDAEACIACGMCAMNCPDMALSVYKEV